jgi:hypothetical protein
MENWLVDLWVKHHWLVIFAAAVSAPKVMARFGAMDALVTRNYAMVQVAEALAKAGVKLVPDIVAGGSNGTGGTLVDVLLANVIRNGQAPRVPETSNS